MAQPFLGFGDCLGGFPLLDPGLQQGDDGFFRLGFDGCGNGFALFIEGGGGGVGERALCLAAVRALDLRRRLKAEDLAPLLPHVRAPRDAFAELPDELAERVVELVQRAADGAQNTDLRARTDAAVDFVVRHRMNPGIDAEEALDAREYVLRLLDGVRPHRKDPAFVQAVRERVLGYLLGYGVSASNSNLAQFAPPVLLAQEILLALGRAGGPQAAELLLGILENTKNKHRAIACLALGMSGERAGADRLTRYLLDPDPFTRFCAFEALRHLVEYDEFFDWLYAPPEERFAAAEAAFSWLVEHKR